MNFIVVAVVVVVFTSKPISREGPLLILKFINSSIVIGDNQVSREIVLCSPLFVVNEASYSTSKPANRSNWLR